MDNVKNIEAGLTGLTGLGVAIKPRAEQTAEERVESLKMEVRDFQYILNRIVELEQKLWFLENHTHKADGTLVVPFNLVKNYGNSPMTGAMRHSRLN